MEHIWTMLMHKILQNHLLWAFAANLKIGAIYALYPESFSDKNLAFRKVFAFCDSVVPWDLRLRNGGLFHQPALSCGKASHPESMYIKKSCHSTIKWLVDKKNLPIQNVISLSWSNVCIDEIKDIPMGNCLISKILNFRSYFTEEFFLHSSAIDGSDPVLEYI